MFDISICIPTAKEAFSSVKSTIRGLDWYINNGRANRLEYYQKLNHPLLNQMIEERHLPEDEFTKKYIIPFTQELYNKKMYEPYVQKIQEVLPVVQSCYDKLKKLHTNWGFEILPEYHIDLVAYSVGGKYFRDSQNIGHVILGFGNQWKDKSALAHIIVHEMIHLGIEDLIINPHQAQNPPVQQEEKERIVDNLCNYVTKDIIPDYKRKWKDGTCSRFQEVASHCDYMDKVVGNQPQNNLVQAVQRFLKEQGRV